MGGKSIVRKQGTLSHGNEFVNISTSRVGGGGLGASRFRDLDRILVLPKDYITARSPRRWVSKTYKYQNVRKGISYMHL